MMKVQIYEAAIRHASRRDFSYARGFRQRLSRRSQQAHGQAAARQAGGSHGGAVELARDLYIGVAGPWPAIPVWSISPSPAILLGIRTPTAKVENPSPLSTETWIRSGSIETCRLTTASISSFCVAISDVWLTMRRSYSSRICSRSRATGAELMGLRKRNSLMPLSVRRFW